MIELDVLLPAQLDRRAIKLADVGIRVAAVRVAIVGLRVHAEIGAREILLFGAEQRRHVIDRGGGKARLHVIDHLGAAAETSDAVVASMLHQRREDLLRMRDGAMQLVADLAGHALAQRIQPHAADPGLAEPHEADVAQALSGRLLHDEQRVRSLHLEDELPRTDLRDLAVVVALAELIVGPGHAGPAGEQVILLGALHQHALAHNLASVVAEDDVLGLSDIKPGQAVDGDPGEELERIAALDSQLPERRPIADIERVLPGHALVDPVRVFPRLEARAELRVGVHLARNRKSRGMGQARLERRHDLRRRVLVACSSATTPPITMRAYSSIIASTVAERGTPRLVMTELQSPRKASVASFGSRSARNSRAAMPSENNRSIKSW